MLSDCHTTTEGFPAFQRWFTDAIAWYFFQHAKDTETIPLLTKVRNYVRQQTSKSSRPKLHEKNNVQARKTGFLRARISSPD
ncbi:unnamed protein product [Clavelina lepadiformis]|uniref:Uncharacterized protein n=1 Tax=Clavelina lepadiformis TaxID=159417 RepID=A0ABP0GED4_CLALP